MKHTNLMIAPIFIRSETLGLKRNSKKNGECNFGKNVACNYCIEKTSRVLILNKKTASVILKGKNMIYYNILHPPAIYTWGKGSISQV